MKFVAFIFSLFVSSHGQAQDKPGDKLNLEILCGSGAQTSKDIQAFKIIVDLNDTTAISNKLFVGSKLEQVLSAITLRYYQTSGSFLLTEGQEKRIREISKFKDKFSLCFTCTFHQEGSVKRLFYRRNHLSSYSIIETFLSNKL